MENNIDRIYRDHINDLFSYALHFGFDRETCKDAIHDVFYKLCVDKTRLDTINNMRFYLLRALKNRLLDIYKKKKDISELSLDTQYNDLPFTITVTIEDSIIETEEEEKIKNTVESLLKTLTDREREIIYLRFNQECSYEEIAQLMSISVHSCRKLSYKAITKLKMSSLPLSLILLFIH